jgi:ribose-phosphate pyrophosphokinase
MQGFFRKPVDNLFAEPLIARWIRLNVYGWKDAVVVGKNAGGTKRVTSLADTLKLNFGIVTTDRRRLFNASTTFMTDSTLFFDSIARACLRDTPYEQLRHQQQQQKDGLPPVAEAASVATHDYFSTQSSNENYPETSQPSAPTSHLAEDEDENDYTDERARNVVTGRIVQGHLVDDDYPSPVHNAIPSRLSGLEGGFDGHEQLPEATMAASLVSLTSSIQPDHTLGGVYDVAESDDDEAGASHSVEDEKTITLVGDVKDKTVFIIDDMIDKSGSWIAAAETVVKRGGAKRVYCIATHGLFGGDSLEAMEACDAIDGIVVTNSFPISLEKAGQARKLIIIDVATLLSESIRRHHYGERYVLSRFLVSPSCF